MGLKIMMMEGMMMMMIRMFVEVDVVVRIVSVGVVAATLIECFYCSTVSFYL